MAERRDRGFGQRGRTGVPRNGEPESRSEGPGHAGGPGPEIPGGPADPSRAGPERFWHEFGRAGPRGAAEEPSLGPEPQQCLDWCPICRTADVLRATTPPEFRGQLQGMQHDALVALRSLLDSYIDRIEQDERSSARVQDIPID